MFRIIKSGLSQRNNLREIRAPITFLADSVTINQKKLKELDIVVVLIRVYSIGSKVISSSFISLLFQPSFISNKMRRVLHFSRHYQWRLLASCHNIFVVYSKNKTFVSFHYDEESQATRGDRKPAHQFHSPIIVVRHEQNAAEGATNIAPSR
jgi:hypothetical protein